MAPANILIRQEHAEDKIIRQKLVLICGTRLIIHGANKILHAVNALAGFEVAQDGVLRHYICRSGFLIQRFPNGRYYFIDSGLRR